MPIRFRCAYCNQLMGIGRRKAGAIVRCPRCAGEVIVPAEQQTPAANGAGGVNPLFEQDDFGKESADVQALPDKLPNPFGSPPAYSHPPLSGAGSYVADAISEPASASLRRSGLFLPTPILILAVALVLAALVIMFLLGYLVKGSVGP